jgi:hypothetical protein
MQQNFIKALKGLPEHPVTFREKVRDKYWDFKDWLRNTTVGMMWRFRIDHQYLYPIRCYFNPRHKKLRRSIPRVWSDSSEVLRIVNFALITEFYTDEYLDGFVDWESDEPHREFARWLENAYTYITAVRPQLEKEKWASYPPMSDDPLKDINNETPQSYQEKYGKVDWLENAIDSRDKQILLDLVKFKDFLWT